VSSVPGIDLSEPMEYLDLEHGDSIVLSITRSEMGAAQIHPTAVTPRNIRLHMQQNQLSEPPAPGTPITVRIPVLRLFGTRIDKPSPLSYWDISSKTLQANLWPRLKAYEGSILTVTITANGYKPTKRYSVEQ
jgi:hypothetical protein